MKRVENNATLGKPEAKIYPINVARAGSLHYMDPTTKPKKGYNNHGGKGGRKWRQEKR
jgi:hypothetical protein